MRLVQVPKKEEKNAPEQPTFKVPVLQQPPIVNPPSVKPSAVKLPIKIPVANLPVATSPTVQTSSVSDDGDQPSAKNRNMKSNQSATKSKRSSAFEPSPPEIIRRVNVTPAPTKVRVPKVVRFAFDITRNTAMEKIDTKAEDRTHRRQYAESSTSSSSLDSSDDSFSHPPTTNIPPTFHSYRDQTPPGPSSFLETQPARKSVHFSPSTKHNSSFLRKNWNIFQADNMSHDSSDTMVNDGAPGPAHQTANPTWETSQPSNVATDLTGPFDHGIGSTASSEPIYLPDPYDDLDWDSECDSFTDPTDCVVDPEDDAWNSDGAGSTGFRELPEPKYVFRSLEEAYAVISKEPDESSSGKPLEPIFILQPKGKASRPKPSKPPQEPLEPVFIYRNKEDPDLKDPLFVWRPSTDIDRKLRCTHGDNPFIKYPDSAPPKGTSYSQPQPQQPPATSNTTNTANNTTNTKDIKKTSSSSSSSNNGTRRHHRHRTSTSSRHGNNSRNNRNPPSTINEEDGPGSMRGIFSWRDI